MTTSESTILDLVDEGTPDGTALSATDGGEDGTNDGVDEGTPDKNALTTTDGRDDGSSDGYKEITNTSTNLTQHSNPQPAPSTGTLDRHQSHQLILRSIFLCGSTLKPQLGSIVLVMD